LRRLWAKFYNRDGVLLVNDEKATPAELKTLHKTIKKISEDIENFSFNTSVAAFMICLNELGDCSKREVLEPLTALIAPFAPHIAEELWHEALGKTTSVCDAEFPVFNAEYLVENSFEYPVMINGKLRFKQEYALNLEQDEISKHIVTTEGAQKWLEGKQPKKIIVVKGKIINIVM
jgi:leucyl-tRNA synthetase